MRSGGSGRRTWPLWYGFTRCLPLCRLVPGQDFDLAKLDPAVQKGLGANRPQDAIYPTSEMDSDGKPYDGAHKYVIRDSKISPKHWRIRAQTLIYLLIIS